MRKIFFLVLFIINLLNANNILQKVENLVGVTQFNTHNNLINVLFANENRFKKTNDNYDYELIFKTLQDNGLLKLNLFAPQDINVVFIVNTNPIKALKILNDTLHAMGYSYYFTKSTTYNKDTNNLRWEIKLNAEYLIDPSLLIKELKLQFCTIIDVQTTNKVSWQYTINMDRAIISDAIKIGNSEKIVLQKPIRPYLLKVQNATSLRVISKALNHWSPYIVFYDINLNILKIVKEDNRTQRYKTDVPQETAYIKITDIYTLINIKRGLTIILK
jgi:hypothetical protein